MQVAGSAADESVQVHMEKEEALTLHVGLVTLMQYIDERIEDEDVKPDDKVWLDGEASEIIPTTWRQVRRLIEELDTPINGGLGSEAFDIEDWWTDV